MSTNSTSEDVLRFVRLRLPNEEADRPFSLRIVSKSELSTDLAFILVSVAREDRRDRAEEWFDSDGNRIISDISENVVYIQILEVIQTVLTESESPTLRTLFTELEDRDLFEEVDTEARDTLAEHLSDVLLATFYAPQLKPSNFNDFDRVLRVLLLLKIAEQEEVTSDDLRSRGRSPDFLDLDLREVFTWPLLLPEPLEPDYERMFSVGVADLLVVKQHIKSYEPGEIAHIENVMASEKRERTHRRLDRTEEIFTTERETEVEKETELETTERFEMSEEVSRTVKEDQQLKFGLGLSGKYGPTVEFSSDFEFRRSRSREESSNSSTSYAKDIVERSLERIRERVKRKRTTRILQEIEETNLHSFQNEDDEHITGVYQFVDKVYQAQVFNYGEREMFDLTVPEPASYLWHRRERPDAETDEVEKPKPPEPLRPDVISRLDNDVGPDGEIKEYERLATLYRADVTDLEPPPENITVTLSEEYPKEGASDGDGSSPGESTLVLKATLPEHYKPTKARASGIVFTSNDFRLVTLGFTILDEVSTRKLDFPPDYEYPYPEYIKPLDVHVANLRDVLDTESSDTQREILIFTTKDDDVINFDDDDVGSLPSEGELKIAVLAHEANRYVVSVRIDCQLTEAGRQKWRLDIFNKIQQAYEDRLHEYQEAMARFKQEQQQREEEENLEREFGTSPSRKEEIIRSELKKHCTAIVTEKTYSENGEPPMEIDGSEEDPDPPTFNLENARKNGAFARFFEQAFEWEHLQYVFYPYYWARGETWDQRFDDDDPAHRFRQFLQAGWARVVVPVRPGFEEALHYYLLTGNVWEGRDLPPRIGDDLSMSIADEIRSRTDQGVLQAIPHGSAWDVRVPTSLVYLRETSDLPEWERLDPDSADDPKNYWDWQPVE